MDKIDSYEEHIIEETYKKGKSYFFVFAFIFLVVVVQETLTVFYPPIFKMRISQLLISFTTILFFLLAYKNNKKGWIIPIYAIAMTLSIANDLIVCTLVQTIEDIPEIFTKSHPVGIICYLIILSLGALGARKYLKFTFPILIVLYDINAYFMGIENTQQLILINTLTLFLSYQMHINERFRKHNFYTFKDTIDDKDTKLLETNKELKKVNGKLTEINFALSHDLKTPVHNIKIFSDLLIKEQHQGEELERQYLKFVHQSSKHIYDLIEAISHYANLSFGEDLKLEEVDVATIFKNLKNNYQGLIHEKQLELRIKENPPMVKGNYSKIYMIMQNIIDNGIKYNHSKLKQIDIDHYQKNGKNYFEIKDNGIGIDKIYQQQIFQPFKRLHNREVYEGSGMGLAFCTEYMHQLGGKIRLNSEIGQGSIFTLEFPVGKRSKAAVPESSLMPLAN